MIDRSFSEANHTYEILCLEHQGCYLYAEVIQVIATRQRYWVRPLFLRIDPPAAADHPNGQPMSSVVHNLESGSDLVWPQRFFRPALDTELLPLLIESQLDSALAVDDPGAQCDRDQQAKQALGQLIEEVWQAFPEEFSR